MKVKGIILIITSVLILVAIIIGYYYLACLPIIALDDGVTARTEEIRKTYLGD